jgi:hypothetical protein
MLPHDIILSMKHMMIFGGFWIAIFLLFLHPINASDFYHHLNTGRYIVEHTALPYTDDLSFTAYGKPWIAHSWATGLLYYFLYTTTGHVGITLLTALIGLICAYSLWRILETLKIPLELRMLATWLASSLISLRWPTRPEILGPMFLITLIAILVTRKRLTWHLIIFFWIWGIFYGSSAFLGLLLLLCYILITRPLPIRSFILLVGCFIASLLNGYGFGTFLYIFQIPAIAAHTGEWLPLMQTIDRSMPELALLYQHIVLTYVLFSVYTIAVVLFTLKQKPTLLRTHLFFAGLVLLFAIPYKTNRFLNLAPLMVLPFLAIAIFHYSKKLKTICIVLMIFLAGLSTWTRFWTYSTGFGEEFNAKPMQFLKNAGIQGNIFAIQELGGLISWHMPESKVLLDTRDDLYQPTGIFQTLLSLDRGETSISSILDRYDISIVIGDLANGTVYKPLLYTDAWRLVMITDGFFVAIRSDMAVDKNLTDLGALDPLRIPPSKPGMETRALSQMIQVVSEDPNSAENTMRLAELHYALGKPEEALRLAKRANLDKPTFGPRSTIMTIASGELLGKYALGAGKCDEAGIVLARVEKASRGGLIFAPSDRFPTVVDHLLGDYYLSCARDPKQARIYYERFLKANSNPLERRTIEQKLDTLDK